MTFRLKQLSSPAPKNWSLLSMKKTHHGQKHHDPYHWLKDPNYPKVEEPKIIEYLDSENDYFRKFLASHQVFYR